MAMVLRGGRAGRGAMHAPQVRAMVRGSAKRDAGKKLVPALRPPQIVRLPWNSYTFSATYSTQQSAEITVSIGSIRSQIISQMGLTGAPGIISMKVNSAYAWNTAAGGLEQPSLQGLFWELQTDSGGSYSVGVSNTIMEHSTSQPASGTCTRSRIGRRCTQFKTTL